MKQLWELSTSDLPADREAIMRRGNVYQIANGYMGYRGTLDEYGPEQLVGITLAGIFDKVGNAWREPVNAPNGAYTLVSMDGVELSALGKRVKSHRQVLRFVNASFERETLFTYKGKRLTLRSERILSVDTPNLGIVRVTLSCDKAARLRIATGIDCNIWDLNGPHLQELSTETSDEVLSVNGVTVENHRNVAVAELVDCKFGEQGFEKKDKRHLRVITLRAEPGQVYTFTKYFAVVTDQDPVARTMPAVAAAAAIVCKARTDGYEGCLRRHNEEWLRRWDRCDVQIEGDDEAQRALRYSILQLLQVAPVTGSANSIPARALSGQVYKGAIFWDTEMFMFPFFVHSFPEKAVELLRYRIKTLDGARRKALTEGPGYRGAYYAWESQDTGDDACTYFNIGDPFTGRDLRTHFRDKQVHISGDIAIALWEYFRITGDDSLLLEGGAEVILECARFYYSYAYYKKDKGRFEILDVIGPDEYHERVNNNAFTSMVARETFAIANEAVAYLRLVHPKPLEALLQKLAIEPELEGFVEAEKHLFVPAPHAKTGLIEQFDGYLKLKDTPIQELKAKLVHPNEYLGAGQGLAVPTQVIKQADVVMMLNLFRSRFNSRIKRINWEYYEPRTEHGSSLSACAYAMVASEFGNLDFAYKYFLKTAKIDLEAKYKVFVGTIFMGGSHPAANGGAWMTAIQGFGGVQASGDQLRICPRLVPKWKSLRFRLCYKGDAFRITIEHGKVLIEADQANRQPHTVVIHSRKSLVHPGASKRISY
jgi:kojibiose phosphorylase